MHLDTLTAGVGAVNPRVLCVSSKNLKQDEAQQAVGGLWLCAASCVFCSCGPCEEPNLVCGHCPSKRDTIGMAPLTKVLAIPERGEALE